MSYDLGRDVPGFGCSPWIGKFNLRSGTGWRAFFQFFPGPPLSTCFFGETSKIVRTGDFFGPQEFSG